MTLYEYKRKRNFAKTPEPGTPKARHKRTKLLRFVVQEHEARRLHFDFRLETKRGILKSWAVPKGLTLDPKVKRLAILTEDHPSDYLYFEGKIPKGNYGAGTVIVWDTGDYSIDGNVEEQFRNGNIKIILHGKKLRGSFHLVRLKNSEKEWLIIKTKDEFCSAEDLTTTMPESVLSGRTNAQVNRKLEIHTESYGARNGSLEDFPTSVKPMLAVPVDKPFDNKDWAFEIKWDGVRAVLFLNKSKNLLEIQARSGLSITHRYPEVTSIAQSVIECENSVILDGEIVVLNSEGAPDFQRHQKRMNADSRKDIESLSHSAPATYFVFDILHLDGRNLKQLEFLERRAVLSKVLRGRSHRMRISDYIEESGKVVFESAVNMKLEGIVGKQKNSKYLEGTRSPSWVKIKSIQTQDCIVIGYTPGEGNRDGYFGSLILAANNNGKLQFIGHSGSGFTFAQLQDIFEKLDKLRTSGCPIDHVPYVNREPVWVRPTTVVEVKFNGWTKDQIMRAPIFLRLRGDKLPEECIIGVQETAKIVPREKPVRSKEYAFSNLSKVFWPATSHQRALKKRDLVEYYDQVSPFILPHLVNRPLSLSRYPDGINGKSFYHKNWDQTMPRNAKTVQIFSEPKNGAINCLVCNNRETLLWLASLGCIEMHPWYSRVHDFSACKRVAMTGDEPDSSDQQKCGLDTPGYIIFDLDPYIYSGKEMAGGEPEYNVRGFKAAIEVAFELKSLFDQFKIESFVKTSGKTGLHIFVPVAPIYSYKQTRNFAEIVGKMLRRELPDQVSMEWNTLKRKGKVFFDYNQNAKGKTVASVLSARPSLSATVSMPVKWNELDQVLPTDFTILSVPEILRKNGDPWSEILGIKQDLGKTLEKT